MKRIFALLTPCLLVAAFAGTARSDLRTWTDRTGKYSVVAELLHADEQNITLGRDGKQRTIPLAALCNADQQFVRKALATAKMSEASPFVSAATAGKEPAAASEQFTVFGIKAGMTHSEVVQVLKKIPGMKVDVDYWNIHANRDDTTTRQTQVRVFFAEVPHERVVVHVEYFTGFTRTGEVDGDAWFRQTRDELVRRYGDFERPGETLTLTQNREGFTITVASSDVRLQAEKFEQFKRDKLRPTWSGPKPEF